MDSRGEICGIVDRPERFWRNGNPRVTVMPAKPGKATELAKELLREIELRQIDVTLSFSA